MDSDSNLIRAGCRLAIERPLQRVLNFLVGQEVIREWPPGTARPEQQICGAGRLRVFG